MPGPAFFSEKMMNLEDFIGYLNTWSAVQHYIRKNNSNPVTELMKKISTEFDGDLRLKIIFPIFMRIGKIKK